MFDVIKVKVKAMHGSCQRCFVSINWSYFHVAIFSSLHNIFWQAGFCHLSILIYRSVLLSSEADLLGDIRAVGDIQDGKASLDDNIPPSFLLMLMNELASSSDEKDEHDPSLQVLCSLFTRLLLQNLKVLLPFFISRAKFNSSEVRERKCFRYNEASMYIIGSKEKLP